MNAKNTFYDYQKLLRIRNKYLAVNVFALIAFEFLHSIFGAKLFFLYVAYGILWFFLYFNDCIY